MTHLQLRVWLETLPHTYPCYYDGDLYCTLCGEPWDSYGIDHGDMTEEEAKEFKAGKGCPSCEQKEERMEETKAMKSGGWRFYECTQCGRQYPAKSENPKSMCLFCLQSPQGKEKR